MDKIVQKYQHQTPPTQEDATPIEHEPTKRHPQGRPSDNTRSKTSGVNVQRMVNDIDYKSGQMVVEVTPVASKEESTFNVNDRVVLHSVKGDVFHGVVRWLGMTRVSREVNTDPVPAVGVEIVSDFMIVLHYCVLLFLGEND